MPTCTTSAARRAVAACASLDTEAVDFYGGTALHHNDRLSTTIIVHLSSCPPTLASRARNLHFFDQLGTFLSSSLREEEGERASAFGGSDDEKCNELLSGTS